jgi:hypothetical protein
MLGDLEDERRRSTDEGLVPLGDVRLADEAPGGGQCGPHKASG